jgi:hypothetical protein
MHVLHAGETDFYVVHVHAYAWNKKVQDCQHVLELLLHFYLQPVLLHSSNPWAACRGPRGDTVLFDNLDAFGK